MKSKGGGRPRIPDEISKKCISLSEQGFSYRFIAESLSVSIGTISNIIKNHSSS